MNVFNQFWFINIFKLRCSIIVYVNYDNNVCMYKLFLKKDCEIKAFMSNLYFLISSKRTFYNYTY